MSKTSKNVVFDVVMNELENNNTHPKQLKISFGQPLPLNTEKSQIFFHTIDGQRITLITT